MTRFDTLIERLVAATGPDRELDGAIAVCMGWTFQKMKGDQRPYYRKPGHLEYYMRDEQPYYTSEISAALTLVQKDMHWNLHGKAGDEKNSSASVYGERAIAPTPAIALCLAALRARATQPEQST